MEPLSEPEPVPSTSTAPAVGGKRARPVDEEESEEPLTSEPDQAKKPRVLSFGHLQPTGQAAPSQPTAALEIAIVSSDDEEETPAAAAAAEAPADEDMDEDEEVESQADTEVPEDDGEGVDEDDDDEEEGEIDDDDDAVNNEEGGGGDDIVVVESDEEEAGGADVLQQPSQAVVPEVESSQEEVASAADGGDGAAGGGGRTVPGAAASSVVTTQPEEESAPSDLATQEGLATATSVDISQLSGETPASVAPVRQESQRIPVLETGGAQTPPPTRGRGQGTRPPGRLNRQPIVWDPSTPPSQAAGPARGRGSAGRARRSRPGRGSGITRAAPRGGQ